MVSHVMKLCRNGGPLAYFNVNDTPWQMTQDVQLDKDTLDVLKADDITSRVYQNRDNGRIATLFVAYFETQRTGKAALTQELLAGERLDALAIR